MMSVFTLLLTIKFEGTKNDIGCVASFRPLFEEVRVFFLGLLFLELRAACHFFTKFRSRLDTIMFFFFEVRAQHQQQRPRSHLSLLQHSYESLALF